MSRGQEWKNMLRVFVSFTFKHLKGERRILLDKVEFGPYQCGYGKILFWMARLLRKCHQFGSSVVFKPVPVRIITVLSPFDVS
jgi:hypothetical protein